MVFPAAKHSTAAGTRRTAFVQRRRDIAASAFLANEEPGLGELLDDPMTRRLMASDGITPETLRTIITQAQERLRQ